MAGRVFSIIKSKGDKSSLWGESGKDFETGVTAEQDLP